MIEKNTCTSGWKPRCTAKLPITLFCIHGNHEERPHLISTYIEKIWHGGLVYYEEEYPNILFAADGEIYDFNRNKAIVIGGAYSIDEESKEFFYNLNDKILKRGERIIQIINS